MGVHTHTPVGCRSRSHEELARLRQRETFAAARILSGRTGGAGFLRGHDLDGIEIRCDIPLPLHVDGEDLGDVERAEFEAERDAVSVLA